MDNPHITPHTDTHGVAPEGVIPMIIGKIDIRRNSMVCHSGSSGWLALSGLSNIKRHLTQACARRSAVLSLGYLGSPLQGFEKMQNGQMSESVSRILEARFGQIPKLGVG